MKVKVKNSLYGKRYSNQSEFLTYEGEIVANPKWVDYDAISISTDQHKFRVRVIPKDIIVDIDGLESKYVAPISSERTFTVAGSKGNSYTVTVGSKGKNCTCIAFQYRKSCKHIAIAEAA